MSQPANKEYASVLKKTDTSIQKKNYRLMYRWVSLFRINFLCFISNPKLKSIRKLYTIGYLSVVTIIFGSYFIYHHDRCPNFTVLLLKKETETWPSDMVDSNVSGRGTFVIELTVVEAEKFLNDDP